MADEKNSIPSFYSGFLKLFSGLVVVQGLNFAFSLILPRFYSPDDYASFGVFTAIVLILIEIITLKLDITIFFPNDDATSLEIVHVVFYISSFFSILVLAISILISFFYNPVYLLISLLLLLNGISLSLNAWFNRKKNYKTINNYRISQAILTPVISLILIFLFNLHSGLIWGLVLGQFFGVLYLLFSFKNFQVTLLKRSLVFKYLRKYNQFPKYGVLSSLINSLSKNSIVLFINFFFGAINAGYYTLSTRVLSAPAGMYQSALSQIYLQQASLLNNYELKIYTKKIIWFGFILGVIPVILLLFFGQPIFGFVFGLKWVMAGKMTQFIVLWFFFQVLIGPVGFMLDIKQKLKFELGWNIILFIFRTSAILLGVFLHDLYTMLFFVTVVSILMNLYLLMYVLKLTNEKAN